MVSIIVAASENMVIGKDNMLLWKQSSDMRRFKNITMNNAVIMGRKTYDSIGKPLPNRRNIIISRNENIYITNCEVVNSIESAVKLTNNDCFIIGGSEIYKQSIHLADKIYLTLIHHEFDGDSFFFQPPTSEWKIVSNERFVSDDNNEFDYSFIEYVRL